MLRNVVGGFCRKKGFQQSQLFALSPPKCPILTNLNLLEGQEGTWVRTDPILMLFLMKWGEKELKRGDLGSGVGYCALIFISELPSPS